MTKSGSQTPETKPTFPNHMDIPSPSPTPETPITTPPPPVAVTSTPTSVKPETPEQPKQPPPSHPAPITIPTYSRWFSWSSIHDTERRLVPDFFDGASSFRTPTNYKYLRDSIIRRYYQSPARRITFTDARRGLVADVGSVRRVFDFLECWGLINYAPSGGGGKKEVGKGGEERKGEEEGGERKEESAVKICTGCGAVCSQACFAPDKQAEVVLCARCFVRGNYKAGLTSGDFKRVDIGDGGGALAKSEWSDKETLLLLEAVLHQGDDWKKVAEHVGNGRSQRDCVARFIKLPFGEQFKGSFDGGQANEEPWKSDLGDSEVEEENDDGELPPAKRIHLTPLADTTNPIMAQVSFLSAMVGSDVAQAAAQAAVKAAFDVGAATNDRKNSFSKVEGGQEFTKENGNAIGKSPLEEARSQLKEEHKELEQSISDIVEIQMKEIQEKIVHFEEVELLLEKEWSQLRHMRDLLFSEQLSLLQQKAHQQSTESRSDHPTGF